MAFLHAAPLRGTRWQTPGRRPFGTRRPRPVNRAASVSIPPELLPRRGRCLSLDSRSRLHLAFQQVHQNLDLPEEFIERDDLRPPQRPPEMLEGLRLPPGSPTGRTSCGDCATAPRRREDFGGGERPARAPPCDRGCFVPDRHVDPARSRRDDPGRVRSDHQAEGVGVDHEPGSEPDRRFRSFGHGGTGGRLFHANDCNTVGSRGGGFPTSDRE